MPRIQRLRLGRNGYRRVEMSLGPILSRCHPAVRGAVYATNIFVLTAWNWLKEKVGGKRRSE